MSRPEALTDSQKRRVRRWKAARFALIRQLKSLPTRAELAKELGVSERTIARAMGETKRQARQRFTTIEELFA